MSPYPQLLDSCSVLDVAVDLFVCLNSTTYTSLSNLIKLIWNPYLTITSMTKKFKHLRNKGDTHNFSLSVISESFSSSSEHTKNTLSSRTRRWDYLFSLCVPQYFLYFSTKSEKQAKWRHKHYIHALFSLWFDFIRDWETTVNCYWFLSRATFYSFTTQKYTKIE